MTITLRPARESDAPALTALLLRNREHFRSGEPRRPEGYFSPAHQRKALRAAERAAAEGVAHLFLIEEGRELIGRAQLNSVVRGAFQSASIAYAVDREHTGRGVATDAVRQLIDRAFGPLALHRLQAEVLPGNAASRAVLEACAFTGYGRADRYLFLDGQWQDMDLFQLINDHFVQADAVRAVSRG